MLWPGLRTPCSKCNVECYSFADFHCYQPQQGRDIVVRVSNLEDSPWRSYQLLWLDQTGRFSAITVEEVPDKNLKAAREIALRALELLSSAGVNECAEHLKKALQMDLICKEMLVAVPYLKETDRIGIAEAISEAYLAKYPDKAEGYDALAQVHLQGYINSAGRVSELLVSAEKYATHALQLAVSRDALYTKAQCMRLRNLRPEQVAPVYENLIAGYPNFLLALYDYGLLWLPFVPEKALKIFQQGAKKAPGTNRQTRPC